MTVALFIVLAIAVTAAATLTFDRLLLAQAQWHLRTAQAVREQAAEMLHDAELAAVVHEPTMLLPVVKPMRVRIGDARRGIWEWTREAFTPASEPDWAAGELKAIAAKACDPWADRSRWPLARRATRRRRVRPTPLLFARLPYDPSRQYRVNRPFNQTVKAVA